MSLKRGGGGGLLDISCIVCYLHIYVHLQHVYFGLCPFGIDHEFILEQHVSEKNKSLQNGSHHKKGNADFQFQTKMQLQCRIKQSGREIEPQHGSFHIWDVE